MYKVISLFSGVGGSSSGYKQAGLDVVAAVEFIDHQASNYRLNNKSATVYEADIRELDPTSILNDLNIKIGELDVLDGSPPCASFSSCGASYKHWGKVKEYSNKKQRTDDLFFEYIRFFLLAGIALGFVLGIVSVKKFDDKINEDEIGI